MLGLITVTFQLVTLWGCGPLLEEVQSSQAVKPRLGVVREPDCSGSHQSHRALSRAPRSTCVLPGHSLEF